MKRRQLLRTIAASGLCALPRLATAQAYPQKAITLLVGGAAGSNPDVLVRPIAERVAVALGQPIVVDNRPGAGGIAAMVALKHSAPDGHTLALVTMAQAVFNPYLFANLAYDPLRDLEPVAPLFTGGMVLAAHPSFAAATLPAFVALAAAQPGKLFVATPSLGSPPHIFALLLCRAAGVEVTFVPHKSGAEAMRAVVSGEIALLIDGPVSIAPQVKAGKLVALAVTSRERDAVLPDTPTARESGFDAEGEAWLGIAAPAGTPAGIVQRLNRELTLVATSPEVRAQVAARGLRTLASTPEAFRAQIRGDHAKWGPLIRAAGLTLA